MARKNISSVKFDDMKKAELIELCEGFGLSAPKRATKEDLIRILRTKEQEEKSRKDGSSSAAGSKTSSKAKTGKAIEKEKQLTLHAEEVEKAEMLYKDPIENAMHALDRIKPRSRRGKPQTKVEEKDQTEVELIQSLSDPFFMLSGTFSAVSNTKRLYEGTPDEIEFMNISVKYKNKKVRIPSYHFFPNYKELCEKYPKGRIYSMLQHRLKSAVDFNVLDVSENSAGVTVYNCTRLLAMKIKRCDYWYSQSEKGGWYIDEGDKVEARVLEVWDDHIVVEVYGAETSVPLAEITRTYITNAENEKQTPIVNGDTVNVVVTDIKRARIPENIEGFDFPVKFRASIKAAEPDHQKEYFELVETMETYIGIVTGIETNPSRETDNNQFYCKLADWPVTVKCILAPGVGKRGFLPKKDQEVIVLIRKKEIRRGEKNPYRIYGEIVKVAKQKPIGEVAFSVTG